MSSIIVVDKIPQFLIKGTSLGDGNCFSRSFLLVENNDDKNYHEVRLKAIDYMRKHEKEFRGVLFKLNNTRKDFDNYVNEQSKNYAYMDSTIIAAVACSSKTILSVFTVVKLGNNNFSPINHFKITPKGPLTKPEPTHLYNTQYPGGAGDHFEPLHVRPTVKFELVIFQFYLEILMYLFYINKVHAQAPTEGFWSY